MSTVQNKIAGAPISCGICEVPGWGYQLPMPTPAWNPGTAAVLFIVERSHLGPARLGRGTASGRACQRHAWTTRSRTRTMPDGGRPLVHQPGPPAARCLGVNRRNALAPAAARTSERLG
jgi:hypothetical protein